MNFPHPLNRLSQQSTCLLDLLLQERQALENNHITTLGHLLSQKEECVQQLLQMELELKEQLGRQGFQMDQNGILAWLERQRFSQTLWHQIHATLKVIRDLNNINGLVINRAGRNTQRLLEIITGQSSVTTYRQNGLHFNGKLSRVYGSA